MTSSNASPAKADQNKAKLADLKEKTDQARTAAQAEGATKLDKADHKLHQQEEAGAKLRARHPTPPAATSSKVDAKLDKALKDSFPGSDPVSFVQAAPIQEGDLPLSTVDSNHLKNDKKKDKATG